MIRSLVAGGAGFVGSHLCDRLLLDGREVVAIDNFYTGTRSNVAHLSGNARFSLVEHDVVGALPALGGKFDEVFNLASPASPPQYQRDPIYTLLVNVVGTEKLLARSAADGARFVQASTSEVYGDPEVHPQVESYRGSVNTLGPRACYDEGKRAAEALCMDYRRARGAEVGIVRIFNTYGPRMDLRDGRVVSNFILQALSGEPLTIYGDGSQTRSFCFVSDLVDGLVRMMAARGFAGPVNVGNPTELTMLEIAERVRVLTKTASLVSHHPLPEDDPRKRRPDTTLARERLGFEPRVALAEGLERTVSDFRERIARS